MLRVFVFALGIVFTAFGAMLCLRSGSPGVPLLTTGVMMIVGMSFERWRYRRPDARPPLGLEWQRTGERFVDPETGVNMEVYYDSASGERRYVKVSE